MEQLKRSSAAITVLVIMFAFPIIVHGQYFAKTGKSLPRLGRRVDPGMYDLLNAGVRSISPATSLYKELDSNGDKCLTIDEFEGIYKLPAASQLHLKQTRDDRNDDEMYDRILSAINDK